MSTHPHLPEKILTRLARQLARQLSATEVARLFDIPVSQVVQEDTVVQKQQSATTQTLSQAGLYRVPPGKLSPAAEVKPTKATTQVNALPACRLAPGQALVQRLQQTLGETASPTCR